MELIRFLSIYEQEARSQGSPEADLLKNAIELLREGKEAALLPQLRRLVEVPRTIIPEIAALFLATIDAIEQEHPELKAGYQGRAMRRYVFKPGMRDAFVNEIDFEAANIRVFDRGWYNNSDLPGYDTYLVLDGIDELDNEWKTILTQAIEVFEVKQLT